MEVAAAPLAAAKRTQHHLDRLRDSLPTQENIAAGRLFGGSAAFHLTMLEASGNSLLELLARPIFGNLGL